MLNNGVKYKIMDPIGAFYVGSVVFVITLFGLGMIWTCIPRCRDRMSLGAESLALINV